MSKQKFVWRKEEGETVQFVLYRDGETVADEEAIGLVEKVEDEGNAYGEVGEWLAYHIDQDRTRSFPNKDAAKRGLLKMEELGDDGFEDFENSLVEKGLLEQFYRTGKA